MTDFAPELPSS